MCGLYWQGEILTSMDERQKPGTEAGLQHVFQIVHALIVQLC